MPKVARDKWGVTLAFLVGRTCRPGVAAAPRPRRACVEGSVCSPPRGTACVHVLRAKPCGRLRNQTTSPYAGVLFYSLLRSCFLWLCPGGPLVKIFYEGRSVSDIDDRLDPGSPPAPVWSKSGADLVQASLETSITSVKSLFSGRPSVAWALADGRPER